MRFKVFVALAAMLVPACQGGDKCASETPEASATATNSYGIDHASGETRAAIRDDAGRVTTLRSGKDVPVDLPAGFTVIEGMTVVENTQVRRNGGGLNVVSMEGDVPLDQVVEAYAAQAKAAGVDLAQPVGGPEVATLGGRSAKGLVFALHARRAGAITRVQLTLRQGLD